MPNNPANTSAVITMECGHTNVYGVPWPRRGEPGWCHSCDQFRLTTGAKQTRTTSHVTLTYNKTSEMAVYYGASLPRGIFL